MRRNQFGVLVTLAAVGVVALSACGSTDAQSGMPVPTAQQTQQAQEGVAPVAESNVDGVDLFRGTNKSSKADQSAGDKAPAAAAPEIKAKWVELRSAAVGGLDPAVVNGAGRTIYWFSDDPVDTKVSNCNGECEKQWPPVVVGNGGKVMFSGIKRENIGLVKRNDGRTQVTLGGRPLYLFAKDQQVGDIKGQNVGNKWFVVNPEGKRAVAPTQATPPPAPAKSNGKPATFVTFFTGKNFDDFSGNNFATSVGVSASCADLRGSFQSLTTDGAVKIWSEPGCKGKSAVVTDDVRDTAELGLPAGARSYIHD